MPLIVATFNTALVRWCACVTAIASASAASSDCGSAFGSSTPIIMRICAFSAWPAPTMVFFTRFGAYSATSRPAFAGTSIAMPRAWPSFSVATASRLTKVSSTAASSGRNSSTMRASPSWIVDQPLGERQPCRSVSTEPHATIDQPVALARDHAPAGAAEARIDAEDANRLDHIAPVDST